MKKPSSLISVGERLRFLPTFLFLIFLFLNGRSLASEDHMPDFAFPQTVTVESDSILNQALKTHDDVRALRAAMDLTIARNLLSDSQNVYPSVELFDSISTIISPPYKSIAMILEAEVLRDAYSQNQYVYDERSLPLEESYPANTDEWSAGMFKTRILNLIDSATSSISNAESLPLENIQSLLSDYDSAEKIGLTVPQFIAFKAFSILNSVSQKNSPSIIPFFPQEIDESIEGKSQQKCRALLLDLIDDLSGNNSVVKAMALKFYVNLLPDYETEKGLREAMKKLEGLEGEAIILYELWNRYPSPHDYEAMNDWLQKYPEGYYADKIKFALAQILSQNIRVQLPKVSLSGVPIKGEVTLSNVNKGYLLIYKLNAGQVNNYEELIIRKFNPGRPFRIVELEQDGQKPFTQEKEMELAPLEEGLFVVIPSLTRTLPKGWNKDGYNGNYSTMRISEISLVSTSDANVKDSGRIYVVKGADQQPVNGATVSWFKGDSGKPAGRAVTNREGWVTIPDGYYRIKASYGKSVASTNAGFSFYPQNERTVPYASILTDLPVYRPGDTVKLVVIGWQQNRLNDSLIKNRKVNLVVRDVNFSKILEKELTLDLTGRAVAEVVIPKGRLLGYYSANVSYPDSPSSGGGSVSFLVEEYKLPAFSVKIDKQPSDKDTLNFTGLARTYSGMPVADANVEIDLQFLPWRWGLNGQSASYSQALTTDSEGIFNLSLPLENLKGTIFERGLYVMKAQVTSQAGETESSSPLVFFLGNDLGIRPEIKDITEVTNDSVRFKVPVYDMAGLPVRTLVKYKITDLTTKEDVAQGDFTSPLLVLPSKNLPSGNYLLDFIIDEDINTSTETVVWRETDKQAPYPTPLWIPCSSYSYEEQQKSVEVKFGSFWNDWILFALSDGSRILEMKWLSPSDSLYLEKIEIPDGSPTLFISLSAMHDFMAQNGQITIVPAKSLEKMEVTTESFRPDISAGDKEEWKFTFKVNGRPSPFANVMAVMSDKALNVISDFKWNLNIWKPSLYCKVRMNSFSPGLAVSSRTFTTLPSLTGNTSLIPKWNTYGYPLVSYSGLILRDAVTYKSMARVASRNAAYDSAADMAAVKEEAEEAALESPAAPAGGTDSVETEIRPVEMPLAFFKPNLTADENGEISLAFTVPNFNTTWQLQLAGYNDELLNATIVLDAVASKPVMVKTNLPQFLRTGDKAEISTTIFNNTDSLQAIEGRLLISNPFTGEILKSVEVKPENIEPSASRLISVRFDVPENISLIAVTAIGLGKNCSDGEKGFIPVLPSSTPVIEASTFYIPATEDRIEIAVPKLNRNANVTLKYCDNPMWEVLMALPALTTTESSNALSLAHWLYATLTASDIISSNPHIQSQLTKIYESGDTTLTLSNLEKDPGIKIAALQATPWINQSNAETSRIRDLEKYLDSGLVTNQLDLKVAQLKKLQLPDGGWCWFEGMNSSPFITSEIIGYLGFLQQQGLLTEDLNNMARKAVNYYDNYLIKLRKKDKRLAQGSLINYLYDRKNLDLPMNKEMQILKREALDSATNNWRYYDLVLKTKVASLMWDEPDYKDEAETIASSIKQFIDTRNSIYQEALMLQFFSQKAQDSEGVEKLREKILLQKETLDWGDDYNSISVIRALIASSPKERIIPSLPQLMIDGKILDLPQTQALTGNFTLNLDPKLVSGKKLTIEREEGFPAWGGIVSQYVAPIKSVKNQKVENLAVEKRIYKEDSKGNLKEVSSFRKGDKITVVITIRSGKDMDYVVVSDSRAACLQPDSRNSGMVNADGLLAYREIRNSMTSFFLESLPAGSHIISYECHADRDGEYSLGITSVQCLYSPAQVAHSAGSTLSVIP